MSIFSKPSPAGLAALVAGLALVIIIGLATFNRIDEARHPEPARATPPVPVNTETAAESAFHIERSWRGSLEEEQRATLSAQLTATVVELPYREGERVEAGSVVFRLDDAELVSEQARLQAVAERIAGELETAQSELARQQELFSRELA
jgi:membrane fusion protein (multidrug efflux system)